jgi:hypothetical protein
MTPLPSTIRKVVQQNRVQLTPLVPVLCLGRECLIPHRTRACLQLPKLDVACKRTQKMGHAASYKALQGSGQKIGHADCQRLLFGLYSFVQFVIKRLL